MRDWRSGIVTVTVRDQRYRQHDPILGVVPLRLSEVLTTSSQVTRWYPLDGGVGFGRIRISLLFRSVETRLPPHMLGWDVGTFEFMSDRILALGWNKNTKLKLRTGGSTGKISKTDCHTTHEKDGVYWDVIKNDTAVVRLPVRYRYRSPVVFEFHVAGKRGAVAYAQIWLQHLTDNEETPIDIPIWTTKNGDRLTQNYVTERNWKLKEVPGLEDLAEVGRLQFRARFKSGTDESHAQFVNDNDSRETFQTWEACLTEGVRSRTVLPEVPETIERLHNASLTEGRDVLSSASAEEKEKWMNKEHYPEAHSGAYGHDPKAYTDKDGNKLAEPGVDRPPHDPNNPSSDEDHEQDYDSDSSSDLGIADATTENGSPRAARDNRSQNGYRQSMDSSRPSIDGPMSKRDKKFVEHAGSRTEKRKGRGIMQWKPARNAEFLKNETKFGLNKVKRRFTGGLSGREPQVETETGT